MDTFLGGWQVNGIATNQSGFSAFPDDAEHIGVRAATYCGQTTNGHDAKFKRADLGCD